MNMWKITVDNEKCNGCGECVEGCPGDVYELVDGKATPVNIDECHGCHTCEALCAAEAITVEDE
jgi:NAD-dependent dihydropyrimidine dehydrogenase PreA subunit